MSHAITRNHLQIERTLPMKTSPPSKKASFILCAFLTVSATLLSLETTSAATLLPEILSPSDWPSSNWAEAKSGSPHIGISEISSGENSTGYWLRIQRITTGSPTYNGSGTVYYTAGSSTATPDNQFSNFSGSVEYRPSTGSYAGGIVLRAQNKTYTNSQGFFIAITPSGTPTGNVTGPQLGIYYNTGSDFLNKPDEQARLLAALTLPSALPVQNYQLSFSATGNVISASIYEYDSEGIAKATPLYSLSYTDTQNLYPTSGYIGLRGGQFGGGGSANFRNLQVHVIPEPGTVALLGLTASLLLAQRKRRNNF